MVPSFACRAHEISETDVHINLSICARYRILSDRGEVIAAKSKEIIQAKALMHERTSTQKLLMCDTES